MSSVLDRDELAASPLADLHVIANELGVDGFRRLRKDDLVEAIVARQAGADPAGAAPAEEAATDGPAPGRRRSRRTDVDTDAADAEPVAEPVVADDGEA